MRTALLMFAAAAFAGCGGQAHGGAASSTSFADEFDGPAGARPDPALWIYDLGGSGWGFMPQPAVQQDLDNGRLVQLDLPDARGGFYALRAIYRTDSPPRPAAAWMIQRFAEQAM